MTDETRGFVPVSFKDGQWATAQGEEVPWYEVQTDLVPQADVNGALERVLSVYGVSDVVVDAFDQFRKELKNPTADDDSIPPSAGGKGGGPG